MRWVQPTAAVSERPKRRCRCHPRVILATQHLTVSRIGSERLVVRASLPAAQVCHLLAMDAATHCIRFADKALKPGHVDASAVVPGGAGPVIVSTDGAVVQVRAENACESKISPQSQSSRPARNAHRAAAHFMVSLYRGGAVRAPRSGGVVPGALVLGPKIQDGQTLVGQPLPCDRTMAVSTTPTFVRFEPRRQCPESLVGSFWMVGSNGSPSVALPRSSAHSFPVVTLTPSSWGLVTRWRQWW